MKFKKCDICGNLIIMDGLEFNGNFFCSKKCLNNYVSTIDKEILSRVPTEICDKCSRETLGKEEYFYRISTSIGLKFYGNDEICPKCNSSIKTRWLIASMLPIFPIASYRIISTKDGKYVGKKLLKLYKPQIENGYSITVGILFSIFVTIYLLIF